mmetsp:Transcript_21471/g.59826  ORF Transcript_21471/g.59826 Transcript_21471/m.59826 type:complete len:201 (+) Transcript_21471:346-948(+)
MSPAPPGMLAATPTNKREPSSAVTSLTWTSQYALSCTTGTLAKARPPLPEPGQLKRNPRTSMHSARSPTKMAPGLKSPPGGRPWQLPEFAALALACGADLTASAAAPLSASEAAAVAEFSLPSTNQPTEVAPTTLAGRPRRPSSSSMMRAAAAAPEPAATAAPPPPPLLLLEDGVAPCWGSQGRGKSKKGAHMAPAHTCR